MPLFGFFEKIRFNSSQDLRRASHRGISSQLKYIIFKYLSYVKHISFMTGCSISGRNECLTKS